MIPGIESISVEQAAAIAEYYDQHPEVLVKCLERQIAYLQERLRISERFDCRDGLTGCPVCSKILSADLEHDQ